MSKNIDQLYFRINSVFGILANVCSMLSVVHTALMQNKTKLSVLINSHPHITPRRSFNNILSYE